MKHSFLFKRSARALALTVLLAGSYGLTRGDWSATPVSGEAELTYSERESAPVPLAEGHMLALGVTTGINRNTGSTDYFADAKVTNVETVDLIQGNGSHQGYYTATKGSDAMTAKWQGKVTTVMESGKPRTSFKGTWSYVRGAGRYKNIKGSGTYDGEFLAEDRYRVRWKGEYTK